MSKAWTREMIEDLIMKNDDAVERAIVRLFQIGSLREMDKFAGTHFAQWIQGMNGKSEVVYPPKSLAHPKAIRRWRSKMAGCPMTQARRIALVYSGILADEANGNPEPPTPTTQLTVAEPEPGDVIGIPRQKGVGVADNPDRETLISIRTSLQSASTPVEKYVRNQVLKNQYECDPSVVYDLTAEDLELLLCELGELEPIIDAMNILSGASVEQRAKDIGCSPEDFRV